MKKFKYLMEILFIYIFAYALSFLLTHLLSIENIILRVLVFDVIATIIVYIFSVIFDNSSVYDAYWSVLPPLVAGYLMIEYNAFSLMHIITFVAILLWSIRLTGNWIKVSNGWEYEDWRYKKFYISDILLNIMLLSFLKKYKF